MILAIPRCEVGSKIDNHVYKHTW